MPQNGCPCSAVDRSLPFAWFVCLCMAKAMTWWMPCIFWQGQVLVKARRGRSHANAWPLDSLFRIYTNTRPLIWLNVAAAKDCDWLCDRVRSIDQSMRITDICHPIEDPKPSLGTNRRSSPRISVNYVYSAWDRVNVAWRLDSLWLLVMDVS